MKIKKETRNEKINKIIGRVKKLTTQSKRQLTIDRLKTMKGFEHISDELASQLIDSMKELAAIILKQTNRLNTIKKSKK